MYKHDDLGIRIKENYENVYRFKLTKRTPVIVRMDGRAFHTFTRGFKKPFDNLLMETMQETTKYLCENIEGCVFGYTQSDEISLLLIDYKRFNSAAFFDYNIQKVVSITASAATLAFNRIFKSKVYDLESLWFGDETSVSHNYIEKLEKAIEKGAMFDSRCFNIPKEEVCNYFYWRQLDATRNSIEMAGHAVFSHNSLQNKSCNDIQDMLHELRGINWNDYPTTCKRGTAFYKKKLKVKTIIPNENKEIECERNVWYIDKEIPEFNKDRNYIEKWLVPEEE